MEYLKLPTFFPDATRGVIRSLDSLDLKNARVEGLVVNTYHLMTQPGIEVLKKIGGIKKMMGWDGWIISDSGGFQIFSLIHRDKKMGQIADTGVEFWLESTGGRKKYNLTPELSIQVQFSIGADIMVVLDEFTPHNATTEQAGSSVKRTIEWAKRSKDEFEKQCADRSLTNQNRPLLFGVIQGAHHQALREYCAVELVKIGFDGYGLGGWPFKEDGKTIDLDMIRFNASLTPNDKPRYALGIGDPVSIIESVKCGYQIFDCVLPTRDGRHGRIYNFKENPDQINLLDQPNSFEHLYIDRGVFADDPKPISEFCDCDTCQNYSRAYVNHLFKIGDSLASRLATIHNLRTYTRMIENIRNNK